MRQQRLPEGVRQIIDSARSLSPSDLSLAVEGLARLLAAKVKEVAQTATQSGRAKANAAITQGIAEKLITNAGGIFLGEKQLKELGLLDKNATIPPVPEKFSREFLNATHPIRGGKIAEHIILGFDPNTNAWYCFEKSIVPGSLGTDGRGLSGREQDKLLLDEKGQPKIVGEMKYSSPTDYRPIKNVLDNVIRLQLNNGAKVEDLPFYCIYGRTADTQNADRGCRVLLGNSNQNGSNVNNNYSADNANNNVGLLAGWNFCSSFTSAERSLSTPQACVLSHQAVLGEG